MADDYSAEWNFNKEYKKYFPYVCKTPLKIFYLLALTPRILADKIGRKMQRNMVKKLSHMFHLVLQRLKSYMKIKVMI